LANDRFILHKQSSLHLKIDPAEFRRSDIFSKSVKQRSKFSLKALAQCRLSASHAVCRFLYTGFQVRLDISKVLKLLSQEAVETGKVQVIVISLSNSAKASRRRCKLT